MFFQALEHPTDNKQQQHSADSECKEIGCGFFIKVRHRQPFHKRSTFEGQENGEYVVGTMQQKEMKLLES
ncbi:hypothetical protein BBI11_04335 [Planococcus maritimus]|nr:hypothetical protein BBI11_04335 [Planococcus maritimus]